MSLTFSDVIKVDDLSANVHVCAKQSHRLRRCLPWASNAHNSASIAKNVRHASKIFLTPSNGQPLPPTAALHNSSTLPGSRYTYLHGYRVLDIYLTPSSQFSPFQRYWTYQQLVPKVCLVSLWKLPRHPSVSRPTRPVNASLLEPWHWKDSHWRFFKYSSRLLAIVSGHYGRWIQSSMILAPSRGGKYKQTFGGLFDFPLLPAFAVPPCTKGTINLASESYAFIF